MSFYSQAVNCGLFCHSILIQPGKPIPNCTPTLYLPHNTPACRIQPLVVHSPFDFNDTSPSEKAKARDLTSPGGDQLEPDLIVAVSARSVGGLADILLVKPKYTNVIRMKLWVMPVLVCSVTSCSDFAIFGKIRSARLNKILLFNLLNLLNLNLV